MPGISIWFVRCALAHFAGGLTLGSLLLLAPDGPWAALRPLHAEMLLFGWLVQLAFGVGSWILPFSRGRVADRKLRAALVLLNAGIACVAIGTLGPEGLRPLGRMAEAAAAALYAGHAWPRLRALEKRRD